MQELKVEVAKIGAQMNETNRRLENIERNQDRTLEVITANSVKISEHETTLEDHDRRIGSLEGAVGWVVKGVLGVVIMAVLGLVIKTTGAAHFPVF